ncbi:helix-turn-helix domain-containing protein [Streptomyces longwoodensis]|uniref:helix-turn-helix transcriptional regulator n=1 Tax=Streptomyces longwoodensis TaxID=68231 RepID=UPI002F90C69A|nr:helix-turn-helix transcriptional regulator [Streptomyces longwoodensis]WUC76394.1 helix-turn-helix transcriptional regulator [Streptomyces longwoodensis]
MGLFARDESRADLAAAQLARQATASLAGLLTGLGKTRSDLAKAMGVSPGRVSQILSGDANLTVRTLAAAAEALNADVQIMFVARPTAGDTGTSGHVDSSPVRGSGLPSHL